jgi:exonuclease III
MNNNINPYVLSIVEEYDIDIVILAEYKSDLNQLDEMLFQCRKRLTRWNTIGSERINAWGNYIDVQPGEQNKHYSIQIVNNKYIICGTHMKSDLYGDFTDERTDVAAQIMHEIESVKQKYNSDLVIIIGDMNESTYGKTCLSAKGFHGLPALNENDDAMRTVLGKKYEKMYNPMWNLYGDFSYPPGTYYRSESKLCTPAWFMIDQIIMSQSMVRFLKKDELKIIVECKGEKLYTRDKHPNKQISDHFPIVCKFDMR